MTTYGDYIKANPTDKGAQRLAQAIEADKRHKERSKELHPLAHTPHKVTFPIDPTA